MAAFFLCGSISFTVLQYFLTCICKIQNTKCCKTFIYVYFSFQAGLILKWTHDVVQDLTFNIRCCKGSEHMESITQLKEENTSENEGGTVPLTIVHMQGPLFLFLAGAFFAVSVFLGENSVMLCPNGIFTKYFKHANL